MRLWVLLCLALGACQATGKLVGDDGDGSSTTSHDSADTSVGDSGPTPACNTKNENCGPGKCGGEGSDMLPGSSCLSCHEHGGGEAPTWTAGGTAFTDIYGSAALRGAQIVIHDANGHNIPLTTNSAGNFYTQQPIAMPFTADLTTPNGTLSMVDPSTSGDCSSCHRCGGTSGGKMFGL